MTQLTPQNKSRTWILVLIVGLLALCCCMAIVAGGVVLFRSGNFSLRNYITQAVEINPTDTTPVVTLEAQLESTQPIQPIQTIQPTESVLPAPALVAVEDRFLAVSTSGLWLIDEANALAIQLSSDLVDEPVNLPAGLSTDKHYFAYLTGVREDGGQPLIEVFDLDNQINILTLALNGPNSQVNSQMSLGDAPFEAQRAMQHDASLAWSPDSRKLAFVAAIDADNTDVYLFDTADLSLTRLTDEFSNAASLYWSPDGRFIQYVTINSFGTGAGFGMDAIWVYDMTNGQARVVEQSTSSAEVFLAWEDTNSFSLYSWDAVCTDYNLRVVDAAALSQKILVNSCFSSVDYNSADKFGIFSVTDFNEAYCDCGVPSQAGTYIFGERVPVNGDNEHIRKFDEVIAYGVEALPQTNLFAVYSDEGLDHLYDTSGAFLTIPPRVLGLKPYPSPLEDGLWAWSSYHSGKTGLWLSGGGLNAPAEISPLFTGAPAWSSDGQRLYFFEMNRVFYVEAPHYLPTLLVEVPGGDIKALVK